MAQIAKSVLLALIVIFVVVQPALAYVDPNTGGMLFQLLAVAFATLSAFFLVFSRQIRTLFARIRRSMRGSSGRRGAEAEEGAAGGRPPAESLQQSVGSVKPLQGEDPEARGSSGRD